MRFFLSYSSVWLLFLLLSSSLNASNYIVLAQYDTEETARKERDHYSQIIMKNVILSRISKSQKSQFYTEKSASKYLLKIGPFVTSDAMVYTYLTVKEFFPNAFIVEDSQSELKPPLKGDELIHAKIEVAEDDMLSWIAIFSLAIVGILALFVSSRQIKKINSRYALIEQKQHSLELFLTKMGENIFTLAKEFIKSNEVTGNHLVAPKSEYIKNKLFDETRMMIYFLRLKSKKIKIAHDEFNLNSMMGNILGTLSSNFKEKKIELIFDIDHDTPKMITGDLLHLTEVLIEILQNSMQHTLEGQVKITISVSNKNRLDFQISDTGTGINKDQLSTLFVPTYTKDGEYKGIGLYVAHELSIMMGGALFVEKSDSSGTTISCQVPLTNQKSNEKRKYRLPSRSYIEKSVLLCESNKDAAEAIKKMLNYFKYSVDIVSNNTIVSKTVNISSYDLLMGDIVHFDPIDIETIKEIRREQNLKVVNISSVFIAEKFPSQPYIDEWLKKPLSQERLCDLIIVLFDESGKESVVAQAKNKLENLKVYYPDTIVKTDNIVTENFKDFKGFHILVVDDSSIDQKLFKNIFEKGEMSVTLTNNGEQALEKLQEKDAKYDLVLMDIGMPIMDGYSAISQIRDNPLYDNLPIIASTSMTLESEINKMFHLGANAYLGKPFNIEYLYTILKHFLHTKKEAATQKNPEEKRLVHIKGLDYKKGIRLANNNEELYLEVLKEFLIAYGDSAESLRRMVDENRYQQAKRLCLDMKGLTGAIGAYEMFDIVDSMYKQYIYNNVHLIPKFVETYSDGMVKLLDAIELYKSSRQ